MRQAFEDVARSCEIRVFEFLVSGAGLKPAAELSDVEPQRLWRGQPSRRERRCAAGRRWLLVHEVVAEVVEDLLGSPCSKAGAAPGQAGAASDASATADAWMLVSDLGAQPYRENAAGATGVTPAWSAPPAGLFHAVGVHAFARAASAPPCQRLPAACLFHSLMAGICLGPDGCWVFLLIWKWNVAVGGTAVKARATVRCRAAEAGG